tara:strand:+ start:1753 stop:1983 length:231 start_codon:yes stop_codon:yes gene_type:complete
MPKVGNKHFSYNKKGKAAAKKLAQTTGKKVVYANKGMMVNKNMDTSKNMESRVKTYTPQETAFVATYSKLIKGPNS